MSNLPSIIERLNNKKAPVIEHLQRQSFVKALAEFQLVDGIALSVSCGDGIWDYLALSSDVGINTVMATDIVECPVKDGDVVLLNSRGNWKFQRVIPDNPLPFDDNTFDVAFSQDVIEHTVRPFLFLKEQYRVLRGGGLDNRWYSKSITTNEHNSRDNG